VIGCLLSVIARPPSESYAKSKMKNFSRLFLSLASIGLASLTYASTPALDVTVSNSANKVVYRGKTGSDGTFATAKLAPGSYVVQFNSKDSLKGGPFAAVLSAGKKKVVANSVPAAKFSKGGVAMRVEIGKGMNLTGQVAPVGATMVAANGEDNRKVKYINGHKYVWVTGGLGTNLGGRFVDASAPEAQNVQHSGTDLLQDMQARGRSPDQAGEASRLGAGGQ
jgi:hypothetical protein